VHKITAEGIDSSKVLIEDIMTTPLVTVGRKARVKEVAEKMSAFEIRRIVVVDESGMLVGPITTGDFAKWFARQRNFMDPMLNAIARVKAAKETSTGPYV
jgi:CBS domain-containing protein